MAENKLAISLDANLSQESSKSFWSFVMFRVHPYHSNAIQDFREHCRDVFRLSLCKIFTWCFQNWKKFEIALCLGWSILLKKIIQNITVDLKRGWQKNIVIIIKFRIHIKHLLISHKLYQSLWQRLITVPVFAWRASGMDQRKMTWTVLRYFGSS